MLTCQKTFQLVTLLSALYQLGLSHFHRRLSVLPQYLMWQKKKCKQMHIKFCPTLLFKIPGKHCVQLCTIKLSKLAQIHFPTPVWFLHLFMYHPPYEHETIDCFRIKISGICIHAEKGPSTPYHYSCLISELSCDCILLDLPYFKQLG